MKTLSLTLLLSALTLSQLPAMAQSWEEDKEMIGDIELEAPAPAPTGAAFRSRSSQGLVALGKKMVDKQQHGVAIAYLRAATLEDPQLAEAWFYLAVAYEGVGRDDEAARSFQRYLSLAPSGAHRADASTRLAQIDEREF